MLIMQRKVSQVVVMTIYRIPPIIRTWGGSDARNIPKFDGRENDLCSFRDQVWKIIWSVS